MLHRLEPLRRILHAAATALPAIAASAFLHSSAAAQVNWRIAPEAQLVRLEPGQLGQALTDLAARPDAKRAVLQFARPVTPQDRAALADSGITLLAPLGNNAFFASLNAAELDPVGAAQTIEITSARAIDPAWKVHPYILGGQVPTWAVVSTNEDPVTKAPDPVIGAYVLFHRDFPLGDAQLLLARHNAIIRDTLETINGAVIELPFSRIMSLAGEDAVQWLEQALPQFDTTNTENRAITQANLVHTAPYNLTGAGVKVLVYDAGTARATHQDFGGRLTVHDASGQITHATHVAGTIGGSGVASAGDEKGMAPGVTMVSYGFQWSGGGTFLYSNPGDIETDYTAAVQNQGAHIANNSIGSNTESNGFDCTIQGDYGVTDVLIDSIVRGSLGTPFRVVWANGNERQGSRCDIEGFGDYYSTAPPATAKNHMTVGALNANDDSMTSFSSWGPTDDGRLKPDISAPGCESGGDGGVRSCSASSDTAYSVLCGTSMASPTVCGLAALLLEDFRAQFPGNPDPRNSTLRALFAHTAQDRGNPGPDYQFGFGSVRIKAAIDFMRTGAFIESSVDQGGSVVGFVNAGFGQQLRFTLAWDDAPGTPNVNPALVNDLDLVVIGPGNVRHYPYTLNPTNPSANAVQTAENHRDNIEQVFVQASLPGQYTIEVRGTNVPDGPQPFSLIATNLAAMSISMATALPDLVPPGQPIDIDFAITAINQSLVPGSPTFYYRLDPSDPFTSTPLTPLGGNLYRGTIPGPLCEDTPQFYASAQGSVSGTVFNPPGAPASFFSTDVGEVTVAVDQQMEVDPGWTVGAPGDAATTGIWTRVDPNGTAAQPEDDHSDPGTMCWVTGQGTPGGALGENDVDGGATTLTSSIYDLAAHPEARLSYWRWYSNNTGGAPNADTFVIDISNNNGASWTNAETIGPSGPGTSGGWIFHEFRVADILPVTSQMKLRFIASDFATGSIVEAAIDDVLVSSEGCTNPPGGCEADFDGDNDRDSTDLNILLTNFGCTSSCVGDIDGDDDTDSTDLNILLALIGVPCP